MANVLIRDIPDEIVNDLKQMAKRHNRPLQQELREILVRTASQPYLDVARQATEIRLKLTPSISHLPTVLNCYGRTGTGESGYPPNLPSAI